jgi:hypothetical protein
MRVKLVRRKITRRGYLVDVYDIYIGIRPIYFPFKIKWFLDRKGIPDGQAKELIWKSYLSVKGTKLVTTVE